MPWPDFLLWHDGLLRFVLGHMGALVGNIMPERGGQLLAVVGEDLRIVRATRNGHISHAIVVHIPRA